jgi:hypothetical protein
MDNGTLVGAPGLAAQRGFGLRVSSVIAALALVVGMFVLVQQRADAAPAPAAVTASVASAGAAAAAQIDFRQFVCPTLLAIRAAFASSPFFSFVVAAINPLLVAFGCTISGT